MALIIQAGRALFCLRKDFVLQALRFSDPIRPMRIAVTALSAGDGGQLFSFSLVVSIGPYHQHEAPSPRGLASLRVPKAEVSRVDTQ